MGGEEGRVVLESPARISRTNRLTPIWPPTQLMGLSVWFRYMVVALDDRE